MKVYLKDVPQFMQESYDEYNKCIKIGQSRPLSITFPFNLDMEISRICGMMPDGSLSKNLSSVSFCQGKDMNKVTEFGEIIEKRFHLKPSYRKYPRYMTVSIHGKSLCHFL